MYSDGRRKSRCAGQNLRGDPLGPGLDEIEPSIVHDPRGDVVEQRITDGIGKLIGDAGTFQVEIHGYVDKVLPAGFPFGFGHAAVSI